MNYTTSRISLARFSAATKVEARTAQSTKRCLKDVREVCHFSGTSFGRLFETSFSNSCRLGELSREFLGFSPRRSARGGENEEEKWRAEAPEAVSPNSSRIDPTRRSTLTDFQFTTGRTAGDVSLRR